MKMPLTGRSDCSPDNSICTYTSEFLSVPPQGVGFSEGDRFVVRYTNDSAIAVLFGKRQGADTALPVFDFFMVSD